MPLLMLDTQIENPPVSSSATAPSGQPVANSAQFMSSGSMSHPIQPMVIQTPAPAGGGAVMRIVDRATTGEAFTWVLIAGTFIAVVAISKLSSTIKAVSRERTRREIAAYIAEGTMSPEQGERLMRAGRSEQQSC